MRQKDKYFHLIFVLLSLIPVKGLEAGLLRMESQTLFSVRNDPNKNIEFPAIEFFEGSYLSGQDRFSLNTNFGLSNYSDQKFNLYILDFTYRPIEDLVLRGGRSFNFRTSRTMSTDSAELDYYFLDNAISVGALGGLERRNFKKSLTSTTRFVGAHADYRGKSMTPLLIGTKYLFRTPADHATSPDQHLVSLSIDQPFLYSWSPEFLANSEMNVGNKKHLNLAEVGFDLYPTYSSALRVRGLTFHIDPRDDIDEPIYSVISKGRLYEGSLQGEYHFIPELTGSFALAYDNYERQINDRTYGYRFELGLKYSRETFSIFNSAYCFKSYGGDVYGDRIKLTKDFTQRVQLELISDTTYYDKITSSKRFALDNEIWVSFWAFNRFKFNTGVELDSNNSYRYDFRFSAKLTYLLWGEL